MEYKRRGPGPMTVACVSFFCSSARPRGVTPGPVTIRLCNGPWFIRSARSARPASVTRVSKRFSDSDPREVEDQPNAGVTDAR